MRTLKGLKDRVEILNELRFYFRHEQKLLKEGWITESDFFEIVERLIRDYAAIILKEWKNLGLRLSAEDLLLKNVFYLRLYFEFYVIIYER